MADDWRTADAEALFDAILRLETPADAERFFRDLCTLNEIHDMSQRWAVVRLLEQYGYRARAAARFSEAAGGLIGHRQEHFTVVLAAVAAGRTELLRLHRAGSIHDTVLHALEQELDLEEMSARRHLGAP